MVRMLRGAIAVLTFLLGIEVLPASASEDVTGPTWVSVVAVDVATTESEILDEAIRRPRARSVASKPFTIAVPTEAECNFDFIYPDGIGRDRDIGFLHKVFVVTPPPSDRPDARWTRTQQQGLACRLPPPPEEATARAPAGTMLRHVSELAILPAPAIGISPAAEGITGAPIRLWAAGIPSGWVALPAAALDGKRVEIEARPTGFAWDTGDTGTAAPRSTYEMPHGGNPSSPAVEHVYETKSSVGSPGGGVYTISVAVTWERRYRVVGVTDPCNDWCDLGPGRTSASMPYRVAEVRAVLVP